MIRLPSIISQTHCYVCNKHTVTGKHYVFYPYGMTEEYDCGEYIEVYLCKDCLKMMRERKRLADKYLTKDELDFVNHYPNTNFKRVSVKRRA